MKRRCAIYTRKSSEEGLDQAFNSLDAQREACEAYVQSQRHEGWQTVKTHFDDGGYSGGTLERPALTRLLDDITARKVQVIVVYKVDRLTRSLADFAKLVELFDAHDVSFVSVTQQFNTTTSMGRLTLNVLLSFAQFEREVTGERIRDKIAASKKKGMWMGGRTPLGYDVNDRQLIINPAEAESVRDMFNGYLSLKNVRTLKAQLDEHGITSKKRQDRSGKTTGGTPLSRGALYKILTNPVYRGAIRHKQTTYAGKHEAIIDDETWQRVQSLLTSNNVAAKHGLRAKEPSLLAGKLFDDRGHPMSPSHAVKNGKRYRYYISQALIQKSRSKSGSLSRIPAAEIELAVTRQIKILLSSPAQLADAIEASPEEMRLLGISAASFPKELSNDHAILREIVVKVTISAAAMEIRLSTNAIREALRLRTKDRDKRIDLQHRVSLQRCRGEAKLIVSDEKLDPETAPIPSLVKAVSRAYVWNQMLMSGEVSSLSELARCEDLTDRYVRHILPLAYLAPDIVETILHGRHRQSLTIDTLLDIATSDWPPQRATL